MKLGIDVDDVLAGFIDRFRVIAKQMYPGREKFDLAPSDWFWTNWEMTPEENKAIWDKILGIPYFHTGLNVLPDTYLLQELTDKHDCYFVTARYTTGNVSAKLQTEAWLSNRFKISYPTVIIAHHKIPVINALGLEAFIDDKAETVRKAAEETKAEITLMTRPHNLWLDYPLRVDNFNQWASKFLEK